MYVTHYYQYLNFCNEFLNEINKIFRRMLRKSEPPTQPWRRERSNFLSLVHSRIRKSSSSIRKLKITTRLRTASSRHRPPTTARCYRRSRRCRDLKSATWTSLKSALKVVSQLLYILYKIKISKGSTEVVFFFLLEEQQCFIIVYYSI